MMKQHDTIKFGDYMILRLNKNMPLFLKIVDMKTGKVSDGLSTTKDYEELKDILIDGLKNNREISEVLRTETTDCIWWNE